MDPVVSPVRIDKKRWKSSALFKTWLRPVQKLFRERDGNEDSQDVLKRAEKKTGRGESTSQSGEQGSKVLIPALPRTALRKKRHDSTHNSPLASIPETEDDVEEIEALTISEVRQTARATFLGIPPELRNQIYTHVFSSWQTTQGLQFLQTCKQVYAEAANLAFSKTLFRIHTEHWPDQDYFQAKYISQLPPSRLSSIRHLALRLPRGAPYDCYNSRRLHVDLLALGFHVETLVIFSHYPRPLPRISDYGGVMEMDLCNWLLSTLYNTPSLQNLLILNYESASPGLFDIPSPRLVRLLRGQIFRDVISERQSLSESEFQWHCHCERERAYSVFSAKLGRTVNIAFENGDAMERYGLGHIYDLRLHLNPDELLRAVPLDISSGSYAALLAQKSSGGRKRLSKTFSVLQRYQQTNTRGEMGHQVQELRETGDTASRRKRLSKRLSLQPQPPHSLMQQQEDEEAQRRHRQSWHAGAAPLVPPPPYSVNTNGQ